MTQPIQAAVPPSDGDAPGEPFFRVVRGNPSPEELAALVVVLLTRIRQEAPRPAPEPARSAWADPASLLRHPRYPRVPVSS